MSKNTDLGNLVNGLFVDSSRRVGVGNVSPSVALDVTGAGKFSTTVTSQTGFKLPANGNGTSPTLAYNNSLGFGVSGTGIFFGNLYNSDLTTAMQFRVTNAGGTDITAMTLLSSGNVGIGNTAPVNQLDLNRTGAPTLFDAGFNAVQNGGEIEMRYVAAGQAGGRTGSHIFYTGTTVGGTERMRITSGGGVCINTTTSNNYPLQIESFAGGSCIYLKRSGANGQIAIGGTTSGGSLVFVSANDSGGVQLTNGATSWTSASDSRLKNIISPIDNAVDKLSTLNPVIYSWKSDDTNKENIGLIAQNVEAILPQVIDITKDGFLGIRYTELVPVLVAAIQELKAEIEILKQK